MLIDGSVKFLALTLHCSVCHVLTMYTRIANYIQIFINLFFQISLHGISSACEHKQLVITYTWRNFCPSEFRGVAVCVREREHGRSFPFCV